MAQVRFTNHLKRFFPDLKNGERIDGQTVPEVIAGLEARHPGLASYLIDERGALRRHVNIFIGDTLVSDPERLQDPVTPDSLIFIMQALSGG